MRHTSAEADRAVLDVLRQQGDLITRSQALRAGWSEGTLRYKTRADGPPGIYTNHNGPLTGVQREFAAVLYAGRGCVVSGQAALRRHGVPTPLTDIVAVLIPHSARRQSAGFVRVHRTSRMPERPWLSDGIRWAPVPRAVADVARGGLALREVRALVAAAVQRRQCTIQQLAAELGAGRPQGSGALRAALEEVADGVASAAEGDLRKLVRSGRLPEPLYNASLYAGDQFLAQPDLWWRDAGVPTDLLVHTGWHDYQHTAPRRGAHPHRFRSRSACLGAAGSRVD